MTVPDPLRWPRRPATLLLDIRETPILRGYHVLASLEILLQRGARPKLATLTTGHPEEGLATNVLRYDFDILIDTWEPQDERRFDLYVSVASDWPEDEATTLAIARARHTVLGLVFPHERHSTRHVTIADGNDTAGLADLVQRLAPL